jgi:two-component sensor histidine kinase
VDAASKARQEDGGGAFLENGSAVLEALRLAGVGVWRWRIGTDRLEWTRNLPDVHVLSEAAFDGTLDSFRRDIHPDDSERVWEAIGRSVETGVPYRVAYRTAPRQDSQPIWIEASGGRVTGPDGAAYLTGVCHDVSARIESELELKRRLAQQRAVEQLGSFALSEPPLQQMLERTVATAAEVLDVPLAKILRFSDSADHLVLQAGVGWQEGLVGTATVHIDDDAQAGYTLKQEHPVIVADLLTETRFKGPSLLRRHDVRSGMSVVVPGDQKRPFGVLSIHDTQLRRFDAADSEFLASLANIVATSARQHAAAEHRQLLIREMAHRAGNMLQLVSTIANQTFSGTADIPAARHAFAERLGSLSRANYLVAKGGWTSTRFAQLAEETLQPFRERLSLEGRDILLPPELCFDLGLVLHELATNSAKYGSLAKPTGTVTLSWSLARAPDGVETFTLVWDDPLTTDPTPDRGPGFGSRLLSALVERKWAGRTELATDAGYRMTISVALPA